MAIFAKSQHNVKSLHNIEVSYEFPSHWDHGSFYSCSYVLIAFLLLPQYFSHLLHLFD